MKKVNIYLLSLCSCIFLFYGCTGDGDCQSGTIESTDLEEFGCANPAFSVTVMTLNEFELIRSQEDFDIHIVAKCQPVIDWTKFDLIAGMIQLPNGLTSVDKTLIKDCNSNELTLAVNIRTNNTLVAPSISFNALIPKLRDEERLFVDFTIGS